MAAPATATVFLSDVPDDISECFYPTKPHYARDSELHYTVDNGQFLVEAGEIIWKHADVEGLFGKSGDLGQHNALKVKVERGEALSGLDVHEVAHLVRTFFRMLPEPLVPCLFHHPFVSCMELLDPARRAEEVQTLCFALPASNLSCLRYFLRLLHYVASRDANNRMNPRNLAVVLTPSIIRLKPRTKLMSQEEIRALPLQTSLVEHLIRHADDIGAMTSTVHRHTLDMTEKLLRKKIQKKKKRRKDKEYADLRVKVAHAALDLVAGLHFRPNMCDSVSETFLVDGQHVSSLPGSTILASTSSAADKPRAERQLQLQQQQQQQQKTKTRAQSASVAVMSCRQDRSRSQSTRRRRKARRRKRNQPGSSTLLKDPLLMAWSGVIPVLDDSEEDSSFSEDNSDWSDEGSSSSSSEPNEDNNNDDDGGGGVKQGSRESNAGRKPKARNATRASDGGNDPAGTEKQSAATTGEGNSALLLRRRCCNHSCPDSREAGVTTAESVPASAGNRKEKYVSSLPPVLAANGRQSGGRRPLSDAVNNPRKPLNDGGGHSPPPPSCPSLPGDTAANVIPRRADKFVNLASAKDEEPSPEGGEWMPTIRGSRPGADIGEAGEASGYLADTSANYCIERGKHERGISDYLFDSQRESPQNESLDGFGVDSHERLKSGQQREILHSNDDTENESMNKRNMPNKGNAADKAGSLHAGSIDVADSTGACSSEGVRKQPNAFDITALKTEIYQVDSSLQTGEDDAQEKSFAEKVLSTCITQHFALNGSTASRKVVRTQPAGRLKKRLLLTATSERERAHHTLDAKTETPKQPVAGTPRTDRSEEGQTSVPQAGGTAYGSEDPAGLSEPPESENATTQHKNNNPDSYPPPSPPLSGCRNRQRRFSCGMEIFPPYQRYQFQTEAYQQAMWYHGDYVVDASIQQRMSHDVGRIPPHILQHLEKEGMMTPSSGKQARLSPQRFYASNFPPGSNRQRRMSYGFERMPPHLAHHPKGDRLLDGNEQFQALTLGTRYPVNRYDAIFESDYCVPEPRGLLEMERHPNNLPPHLENEAVDNSQQMFAMNRLPENLPRHLENEVVDHSHQQMLGMESLPDNLPHHLENEVFDNTQQMLPSDMEETLESLLHRQHMEGNRQHRLPRNMEEHPVQFTHRLQNEQRVPPNFKRQRRLSIDIEDSPRRFAQLLHTERSLPFQNRQRRLSCGMPSFLFRTESGGRNEMPPLLRNRQRRLTSDVERHTPPHRAGELDETVISCRDLSFLRERQSQHKSGQYPNDTVSRPPLAPRMTYEFEALSCDNGNAVNYSAPAVRPVSHAVSKQGAFSHIPQNRPQSNSDHGFDGRSPLPSPGNVAYSQQLFTGKVFRNDTAARQGCQWSEKATLENQGTSYEENRFSMHHGSLYEERGDGTLYDNSQFHAEHEDTRSNMGEVWPHEDNPSSDRYFRNQDAHPNYQVAREYGATWNEQTFPSNFNRGYRSSWEHQSCYDNRFPDQTEPEREDVWMQTDDHGTFRFVRERAVPVGENLMIPGNSRIPAGTSTGSQRLQPSSHQQECDDMDFHADQTWRRSAQVAVIGAPQQCSGKTKDWHEHEQQTPRLPESDRSHSIPESDRSHCIPESDRSHCIPESDRSHCIPESCRNGHSRHASVDSVEELVSGEVSGPGVETTDHLENDSDGYSPRFDDEQTRHAFEEPRVEGGKGDEQKADDSVNREHVNPAANNAVHVNKNGPGRENSDDRNGHAGDDGKNEEKDSAKHGDEPGKEITDAHSKSGEHFEKQLLNSHRTNNENPAQPRRESFKKQILNLDIASDKNPTSPRKDNKADNGFHQNLDKTSKMLTREPLQRAMSADQIRLPRRDIRDLDDPDSSRSYYEESARPADGKMEMLKLVDNNGVPLDPRMVGVKSVRRMHRRTSPVCRTRNKADSRAADEGRHGAWDDLDLIDSAQHHPHHRPPPRVTFRTGGSNNVPQQQQQEEEDQPRRKLGPRASFPEGGDVIAVVDDKAAPKKRREEEEEEEGALQVDDGDDYHDDDDDDDNSAAAASKSSSNSSNSSSTIASAKFSASPAPSPEEPSPLSCSANTNGAAPSPPVAPDPRSNASSADNTNGSNTAQVRSSSSSAAAADDAAAAVFAYHAPSRRRFHPANTTPKLLSAPVSYQSPPSAPPSSFPSSATTTPASSWPLRRCNAAFDRGPVPATAPPRARHPHPPRSSK